MLLNFHQYGCINLESNGIKADRYFSYFLKEAGYFSVPTVRSDLPTVTVELAETIPVKSQSSFFGWHWGFDDSCLYRFEGDRKIGFAIEGKRSARVFSEIGVSPEMCFYIAEVLMRNLVPFKGSALLHASFVVFGGKRLIFPAWGGTGKTDLLLQLLAKQAAYGSDDLVFITQDGKVYPYPKPLNILYYNIDANLSLLLSKLDPRKRRYYKRLEQLRGIQRWLSPLSRRRLVRRVNHLLRLNERIGRLKELAADHVPVKTVFDDVALAEAGPIDFVFFLTRMEGSSVVMQPIDHVELAQRMSLCLQYERTYAGPLLLLYSFAFPNKESLVMEMISTEREILISAFQQINNLLWIKVGREVPADKLLAVIEEIVG